MVLDVSDFEAVGDADRDRVEVADRSAVGEAVELVVAVVISVQERDMLRGSVMAELLLYERVDVELIVRLRTVVSDGDVV